MSDPSTNEVEETASIVELSAEYRDLLLSLRVWTKAIDRLEQEKANLLHAVDTSHPDPANAIWLRVMKIDHEVAMYEICLDRAHERSEQYEGMENEEVMLQRERFYRLMRGQAKAGNERASMRDRDVYIGCVDGEDGWSPDRWAAEMEAVARQARKQLVAAITV